MKCGRFGRRSGWALFARNRSIRVWILGQHVYFAIHMSSGVPLAQGVPFIYSLGMVE